MKKLCTILIVMLLGVVLTQGQTVLEKFDNVTKDSTFTVDSEGGDSKAIMSDDTENKVEGEASLKVKAVVGSHHGWGSFTSLNKKVPDSTYINWLSSDTLSLMVYVHEAPVDPDKFVMRMQLRDQLSWDGDTEEYIYENKVMFDEVTNGWVEFKIPLFDRDVNGEETPNDEGFCFFPHSWGTSTTNNNKIDWDKIVWWNIGFVVDGWDANANLPADSVLVSFDNLKSVSTRKMPFVFFNGKTLNSQIGENFSAWGASTIEIAEDEGATPSTHALKWVQGDQWENGWTGILFDIDPAFNMETVWSTDTLKFKMKSDDGVDSIRIQMKDAQGNAVATLVKPIGGNVWNDYAFKLSELKFWDGATSFDSSAINKFEIMAEGNGIPGKTLYFDDIWTGQPTFDIIAPVAPTGGLVSPSTYQNLITWSDIPGEDGEKYTIYYSTHPITDLEAAGVEYVGSAPEGIQYIEHLLLYPITDTEVTYHYAIVCTDESGNVGPFASAGNTSNTAKGVTSIHPKAPVNFSADGDLSDWNGIVPFRMYPDDGTAAVPANYDIDGDSDLSMDAYIAMDKDYLYFACDLEDDIIVTDSTLDNYLIDSPDLFIGLYDAHGAPHTAYKTGDETDHHFRFYFKGVIIDNLGTDYFIPISSEDYYWEPKFPTGYTVEGRISFAELAAYTETPVFVPEEGMRIPIDWAVNDADATGQREGMITYSKINEDASYRDVSRWSYTWIGDKIMTDVEEITDMPNEYSLGQNYPNPFNPTTKIQFSVKEESEVSLVVYNVLGQKVKTLVEEVKQPGTYTISLNASNFTSGMYIYQIRMNNFVSSKKMLLLK